MTFLRYNLRWNVHHRRTKFFIVFLLLILLIAFKILCRDEYKMIFVNHHSQKANRKSYLVWSNKCKIVDINPYSKEILKFLERHKPLVCSTEESVTRVDFNNSINKYILSVDEEKIKAFTEVQRSQLKCSYIWIKRITDNSISSSRNIQFKDKVILSENEDGIITSCYINYKYLKDMYALVPEQKGLRGRLNRWKKVDTQRPINVIMLGLDSVSRSNLIRSMPKTAQYLYDNKWFEMAGYNKMGINTFPNLMAVLTGFNEIHSYKRCNKSEIGSLDRCPIIWNTFKENGYVTAYGEDTTGMSTFNYESEGFNAKPVDYYMRPLLIYADVSQKNKYCRIRKASAFNVFDYALELDERYRDHSYFAFLWSNQCHENVNEPTLIDDGMLEYILKLATNGVLDRSVVIFLSDHGTRWGGIRQTMTGFFEDRLPFLFIWLPPWLRQSHPEIAHALQENRNRLTSPYDLHLTLKHILQLSGRIKNFSAAEDCKKCQSLLKPIPEERSCSDAGIPERWCACIESWILVDKRSYRILTMARFSVNNLNEVLKLYKNGELTKVCGIHSLKRIVNAFKIVPSSYIVSDEPTETYLIFFITKPNYAEFEALVRYFTVSKRMEMIDSVNRIGSDSVDAKCITDIFAKNFCSCK